MNILISGAGVAGLTLARCLVDHGHQITIVEKSPTIRTEGYVIDFTGTGWDVADRLGLIPTIRQRAFPTESVIYKSATDKIMSQISVTDLLASTGQDVNYAALNRRDLVLTLYESVCDRVDIRFDTTIQAVEQDDTCVTVQFSDGTSANYDMLLGCDGIHSHTRRLVFGDDHHFEHYLGYQFAIFEIPPLSMDAGRSFHMHVQPDLQVAVYPTASDRWLAFITFASDDPTIPAQADRIPALADRLHNVSWIVPEMFEAVDSTTYVFQDTLTQIQMPTWSQGRIGLIGDAAYCPTLVSGQGASMAMAGAYLLAEAIQQTSSLQDAYQMMDTQLRPHIETIQQSARNFASTFVPKSHFRIHMINLALRLSNIPFFKQMIGKQFTVNSIL